MDNIENKCDFIDVKSMSLEELKEESKRIRNFLVNEVSKTGGHLASNLGVVELTLSLHKVFDFDQDKIVWDVGHQSYVHKLITGRKQGFKQLREYGGMSGFPKTCESQYDFFNTGHSSTSISAALGMARARDLEGKDHDVIAVIGDGALTGGMAMEALNDVAYNKTNMIIVLNDNQMSISKNVGGVSAYLSKLRYAPRYNRFKNNFNKTLNKIPVMGKKIISGLEKLKGGIKQIVVPVMYFEDLGVKYFGPIDGHNVKDLVEVFESAKLINGPVVIHVITKKGKGYEFAELNPNKFHGIGAFNPEDGEIIGKNHNTYSKEFGNYIIECAQINTKLVAITAAMPDGTGLSKFSKIFPKRFFDVGIAEQHAVTLAAGMASQGLRPIFAVYSTFLQRSYDQILHDVCLQNLPVIFAIDRAGIVGKDGETHQGIFDLSYLNNIPNMVIVCPKCVEEISVLLDWALQHNGPVAIRYPRGGDCSSVKLTPRATVELATYEKICGASAIKVIATGKMVELAVITKQLLEKENIEIEIINASFVKPVDKNMIREISKSSTHVITMEDNVIIGGMGSLILQELNNCRYEGQFMSFGYEDTFIPHGSPELLYDLYGLSPKKMAERIINFVEGK
ncbi:1-deoxy-D-xylulose-5-phosphate synthase [Hathewaya proteolytica DSM 3090]|uniref:1-deoxy-D-xylulose-5-phosphate synthase n=2 Tax=Hathewaya proteolytica TaxID=29365 RepID=A0A1M6N7S9_9CLOT|nr:1-deoxy-D-xylulose-5-phosphate synthase [Hathewaya proteolytica DSM 3090]